MTDRAVSTVLSYALSLSIIMLLVTGVFVTTSDYVTSERDRTIRSEFEVLGNRVAADVAAVDRMAVVDGGSTAELRTGLPTTAAGSSYRIDVTNNASGANTITLSTASEPSVSVTTTVETESRLANKTIAGGDIVITYNGSVVEVSRD